MTGEKSALITLLNADFDWWKERYANKELYRSEKERVAEDVKTIAQKYYPETKGKIETVDVATPMTYVRYCNAWQGSWMAWANTPSGKIRFVPGELPGLENFFLTGQWTLPPGGLPTAVVTGRWVIQRICRLEKKKFSPDN
jgi:phytoene dehydrogenase-like protein